MRRKKDHEKRKKHLRPVAGRSHFEAKGDRGYCRVFNRYFRLGDDMTEEQRQAALEALCRLEPDAKNYREEYHTQCESADGDAMIVRAAIQSPPVPVIEGLDEAIIVLSEHNKWRRGEHPYDGDHPQPMEITPKQLGLAIECVLKASSAYAKLQKG